MTDPKPILPFSGERFTPECVREMWYEHFARYAMAIDFVRGMDVLDCACGEGYGSALLASYARRVVGADISHASLKHAQARYGSQANLEFIQRDATRDALPSGAFDVVISFETLEHVLAQDELMRNFKQALKPGGLLLISSPDKFEYSDKPGYQNEFHCNELYRAELVDLIARHFAAHRLFGQKLLFQSAIFPLDVRCDLQQVSTMQNDQQVVDHADYAPLYFIAACSNDPAKIAQMQNKTFWFGDQAQSVYQHYNNEIARVIAGGRRILELEAELTSLREQLNLLKTISTP
jgi:SAM-dependent methyltransferase